MHRYFNSGMKGFEPLYNGIKIHGLTIWLHPKNIYDQDNFHIFIIYLLST